MPNDPTTPKAVPVCFEVSKTPSPFLELLPDARTRWGFPIGLLQHYVVQPNPEASATRPDVPDRRLVLLFPTADVVITGWRLAHLLADLCAGKIVRLRAQDVRFLNLHRDGPGPNEQPFIASIKILPPGSQPVS
ncbi:MAG: hypothetical protein ABSH19_00245 [Opitutales bacterium]|jgi:hypothetical protein